jgi:hypothetical protein
MVWFKNGSDFDRAVKASQFTGERIADFIYESIVERTDRVLATAEDVEPMEQLRIRLATVRSQLDWEVADLDRLEEAIIHRDFDGAKEALSASREIVDEAVHEDPKLWLLLDMQVILDEMDLLLSRH